MRRQTSAAGWIWNIDTVWTPPPCTGWPFWVAIPRNASLWTINCFDPQTLTSSRDISRLFPVSQASSVCVTRVCAIFQYEFCRRSPKASPAGAYDQSCVPPACSSLSSLSTCISFCRESAFSPQQTQNICITFVQCWTNVEDVRP